MSLHSQRPMTVSAMMTKARSARRDRLLHDPPTFCGFFGPRIAERNVVERGEHVRDSGRTFITLLGKARHDEVFEAHGPNWLTMIPPGPWMPM